MKILHTSDWHLGHTLYNYDRTAEQQSFLRQRTRIVTEEQPDAMVVSGDIYHYSSPAAFNGEMGHEDDGKLCRIPFLHFVQQCLEEACLSLVARCFSVQQGEVLRIDVGHGNDVARLSLPKRKMLASTTAGN